jgi:hypothetical protein
VAIRLQNVLNGILPGSSSRRISGYIRLLFHSYKAFKKLPFFAYSFLSNTYILGIVRHSSSSAKKNKGTTMLHSFLRSILLLPLVPLIHALDPKTVIDANGVSLFDKIEAIERQLLNPQVLNSLVVPCSLNAQADPHEGQQTSAEWTRIVFHDVITKGIAGAGLG